MITVYNLNLVLPIFGWSKIRIVEVTVARELKLPRLLLFRQVISSNVPSQTFLYPIRNDSDIYFF
jgi:hypothetical protein